MLKVKHLGIVPTFCWQRAVALAAQTIGQPEEFNAVRDREQQPRQLAPAA